MKQLAVLVLTLLAGTVAAEDLEQNFAAPPPSARPWVYWFPLSGNLTQEGITADFEALARVGIGGLIYMEVDQGAPKGPADFAGPLWRELFNHACKEAARLGLEINLNNDAGWCGSGGPWITPELSMQKVVWSEVEIDGGQRWDVALPQPPAVKDFYRDIAVLAMPAPAGKERILDIQGKASFKPQRIPPPPAVFDEAPAAAVIARDKIVDLTGHVKWHGLPAPDPVAHGLEARATLTWDAPPGKWLVIRFGHTTTGKDNHPAPASGRGLECDKFSKQAAATQFNALVATLVPGNKALVSTHIDSWEVGSQNWTPKMREEFRARRGYDLWRFLPAFTGRIVGSVEVTERFFWDLRQTVSDLIVENYAGEFRRLANKRGLRLSIEAYDGAPTDDITYAGQADEPMAEFWKVGYNTIYSCIEMSGAAHVYGKKILGAEAFTSTDKEKWLEHPGSIKALGDWAFCEGINRFVFHRYAAQPWTNVAPGMSMGPWGLHYERTQTWWEQSKAWHDYLARCQYLLQQGLFVADVLYLQPEGAPRRFTSPAKSRTPYNFDGCSPEVVLTRLSVKDGRLVLPDGMSYRVLVLPDVETMTPALLRKIKELVHAGATVFAPRRPLKAPGLTDYPRCDAEVAKLADELWSGAAGKGRFIAGGDLAAKRPSRPDKPLQFGAAQWIWFNEGKPAHSAPPGVRHFRRTVVLEAGISAGRLLMTADNEFVAAVNGKRVGDGNNFHEGYTLDVTTALKPGTNTITVAATNTTDAPNPAGLIGLLSVQYADGRSLEIPTDHAWEAAQKPEAPWSAALELGPHGMKPWGEAGVTGTATEFFPDVTVVHRWLAQNGVPPDFAADKALNYIHKTIGAAEVYFVANPEPQEIAVEAAFRITGRQPELWHPDTGRIESVAATEKNGCTLVPLQFDPSGSVFVVFRKSSHLAPRDAGTKAFLSRSERTTLSGPWEVSFDPKWGGPASVTFDKLEDWSKRPEPGIKYYSGTATYRTRFTSHASRAFLDLGKVAVMAGVTLNGKFLGTLWKPPYRVDISAALQPGANTLELKVVNLWVNRQIGDEQLPEDCERNKNGTLKSWPQWIQDGKPSPTGRFTFSSWKLWKKDDPLIESGLLGPVTLLEGAHHDTAAGL